MEEKAARQAAEAPSAPDEEKVVLAPALWLDPDVRWLTGVHLADGHFYLVRELYEELLWWLLMPSLLRLAGELAPAHDAIAELSRTVEEALATAEAAGYRIDELIGAAAANAGEAGAEADAPQPSEQAIDSSPDPAADAAEPS